MFEQRSMILGLIAVIIITLGAAFAALSTHPELDHCGAIPPEKTLVIGYDALIVLQSGCKIRAGDSPYLQGSWLQAQPVSPNANYRFDPIWAWVASWFPDATWPVEKQVSILLLGLASISVVFTFAQIFQRIFPDIAWAPYLAIAPWAGILWFQIAFANLDPLLLALSGWQLLAILNKQYLRVGLFTALSFSLKLHLWAAWPIAYLIVTKDWKGFFRSIGFTALFYALLKLILILALGVDQGIKVTLDYYKFILNSPQNIYLLGKEGMWNVFNNSLSQTFMRYFGDQPWIRGAVWVVIVLGAVYLMWLVLTIWRRFANQEIPVGIALLAALQFHIVAMLTSPQLETAMIIMIALPLLMGLRATTKIRGLWTLVPYYLMVPIIILYVITLVPVLDLPYSIPIVLWTLLALGLLFHRSIWTLCGQKQPVSYKSEQLNSQKVSYN